VRLRIWDDRAKAEGLPTPPLAHYMQHLRRCALPAASPPA
jgi:predicted HD phosphohydrolase